MKPNLLLALRRISRRQWSALGLALVLGGLLVAGLFGVMRPGLALAANASEPAVVYACNQTGLNNALAAGGSATFSCAAPTTVTVSGRKLVNKNVSLDGGSKLILSGGSVTGVFTVAAGVHLNLLNLTLRDANVDDYGGDIVNHGVLNVISSQFISNSAPAGASIWNAPGASALISGSNFSYNEGLGGAILNGDSGLGSPAMLQVINSEFFFNQAEVGAAIYNVSRPVTVTGSRFEYNFSAAGGAIYDLGQMRIDDSVFYSNGAGVSAAQSSQPAVLQPAGVGVEGGGGLYVAEGGDVIVASTAFTGNFGVQAGGAILYGTLPLDNNVNLAQGGLSIVNSTFDYNCTNGAGGALASSLSTTVTDSRFTNNGAFSDGCDFFANQSAALSQLPSAPVAATANDLPSVLVGAGGAIFNVGSLNISGGSFVSNTASVTTTGGGGAIANWIEGRLQSNNTLYQGNSALQDGGAIYNNVTARASLAGGNFTGNRVFTGTGGAVANLGLFTATSSSFSGNWALGEGTTEGGGGAIWSSDQSGPILGPASPNGPAANAPAANGGSPPAAPQLLVLTSRLTLDHDTFTGNSSNYEGGALDAGASTIVASTFTSNTARYGGAIDVFSDSMTISASTFTGNAVIAFGLDPAQQGGGIDSNGYNIHVLNSTFFANAATNAARGGAINGDGGAMVIVNSTFLSNTASAAHGGALAANGQFVVSNTVLGFNVGGSCQLTMTLDAHNIDFPSACHSAGQNVDPRALAPANNGGPTFTSALLANSPAINTGNNSGCPGSDQRGAPRPVGGTCDIGAFEFGGLVARLWLPLVRK